MDDCKRDHEGQFLQIIGKYGESTIQLTNLYTPNEDIPELFHGVSESLIGNTTDIQIVGDNFNKVLEPDLDRFTTGKQVKYVGSKSSDILNNFLENSDWVDIWRYGHPGIKQYTYVRHKPVVMSRLDFYLMPISMVGEVQSCEIIPGFLTDHSFVKIEISQNPMVRGKGYWKFNNALLYDGEFLKLINLEIKKIWRGGCGPRG